ncbi:helix-turn-helix transcriptional regulator [Emcibacter sp.]|uniref:helix-turn-helix transcriptional regulator n=1 Tax=Emcibacter sp. TaxID=1979954 RepID=UPI002AA934E6|nr:autoinducer binding domain-containing protein [Emcibacter sp.]
MLDSDPFDIDTMSALRELTGDPSPRSKLPRAPKDPPSYSTREFKSFEAACYKSLYPTTSPEQFCDRLASILEKLGFPNFSLTAVSPHPRLLLHSMPDSLQNTYAQGNYDRVDYAISYANSSRHPILRSRIEDYFSAAPLQTREMARNQDLSILYKSHGFYEFYLIPIVTGGERYLFSITSEDIAPDFLKKLRKHPEAIQLVAEISVSFGQRKFPQHFRAIGLNKKAELHVQPLTVISRMAEEDLPIQQIAHAQDRSVHTVNQHLSKARKALNSRTTHGAIYKAIQEGLIPCPCSRCLEEKDTPNQSYDSQQSNI